MISAKADRRNAHLWSKKVYAWALTNSSIPDHSPQVAAGSFETIKSGPSRTVLVYWKLLHPWEWNGPDFLYTARLEDKNQIKSVDRNKSYVEFSNLTNIGQTVLVTAENIVGSARVDSRLKIPQASFIDGLEPRSVTKVCVYFYLQHSMDIDSNFNFVLVFLVSASRC